MARVVVDVMLKPEILDPQGQAVQRALPRLGFDGIAIADVRQGKRFELDVQGPVDDAALARIEELAGTFLANTVIARRCRCGTVTRTSSRSTPWSCPAGFPTAIQVLTETHLLPGAMLRNNHLHFICRDQKLRVENVTTAWTTEFTAGQEISVPLKNIDGRYVADERTLDMLEAEGRVAFRYVGTRAMWSA